LASHLTADLFDFLMRWLPPPPARVLEVGCGSGELTRRLAASGFEAVGVDPEAPEEERFIRAPLEELTASREFDAAVAIRSLHHLNDPARALDRLAAALRPDSRLVIFEFVVEAVDERVERWLADRDLGRIVSPDQIPHLVALSILRDLLARRFFALLDEPDGYLAYESDRPDLEAEERAAIASGELPPVGARLVYELSA
jgi:SAM-dependent methyltransferase